MDTRTGRIYGLGDLAEAIETTFVGGALLTARVRKYYGEEEE